MDGSSAKLIQGAFADCQVYLGAFYPPNRIARQPVTLIHGQGHLEGSKEITPGIYTGGAWQFLSTSRASIYAIVEEIHTNCLSLSLSQKRFSDLMFSLF